MLLMGVLHVPAYNDKFPLLKISLKFLDCIMHHFQIFPRRDYVVVTKYMPNPLQDQEPTMHAQESMHLNNKSAQP